MEGVAHLKKEVHALRRLVLGGGGGFGGSGSTFTGNLNYVYNAGTSLWHKCEAVGPDGSAVFSMDPTGTTIINGQVLTAIGAVIGIANVVALRAITAHVNYQIAEVLGMAVPGDGGGGRWYYDISSFAVDDGALVAKPNDVLLGNPGRWLRL